MDKPSCFRVGPLPIDGNLILAPMDGYSDSPFRSICRELGSAMSYTEFINALDILHGAPWLEHKLAYCPTERPVVYQLFDDDPYRLLQAALLIQERGADILDINLGCSARTVSGRGAGAGLLRSPEKIACIFQLLTRSLEIPITAKIRLGWDEGSRNYLQVARIIEENGGALIAVHGRTRSQGLKGQADWEAIAEICRAVKIPVIGNGDVASVEDIRRMKAYTGCAGVMIGRAAVGNPWIFAELDRNQVLPEQVYEMVLTHLEKMISFYGLHHGLVQYRKHVSRYISPFPLSQSLHCDLMTATSKGDFQAVLNEIFQAA